MNRKIGSVFSALSAAALFAGCVDGLDDATPAATSDDLVTVSKPGGAPVVLSSFGPTTLGLTAAQAAASSTANAFVASQPAILQVSPRDAFVQGRVASSEGVSYVPYERTYAGLPVVGGDFVTVIDRAGQIAHHSVALQHPIDLASITPKLSQVAAETIATQRLRSVTRVEGTQLVVFALDAAPRLAWESTVNGFGANGISRLTVHVDALTGAVLHEQEHVMYGTGTSAWNGPNPVALSTTQSGSTFTMRDPSITNLSCQDAAAWNAVSVPAQAADPTCGGGGGGGGGGTNLLLNPGFESGAASWTATAGVINSTAGITHTGSFAAWLDGYGATHTDSVFQQVAIPAASTTAQLCYWLRVTTAETTTTTQFDKLQVQIRNSAGTVLTTLATFSNLNASAYHQVCHNVGSFAGQTVRPFFLGTEDSSLQTSFFLDDLTLQ